MHCILKIYAQYSQANILFTYLLVALYALRDLIQYKDVVLPV